MKETIIIGLALNTSILLTFAMLYENFWLKNEASVNVWAKILSGLVLGTIGIVLMFTPWTMIPGIVFDTRSIMLSIAGLFFGPIPTILAMLLTCSLRVIMGGDGMWMGIAVIITSGTIGLLWRYYRPSWRQKNVYIELFVLGIIVHLVMIACAFLLPSDKVILTIKIIAIPLLLIYSPGTMLLGILLLRQSNNFQNRLAKEKLHEAERRLGKILKSGNIISIILDPSGIVVFCNNYLLDITGYSEDEVINKNWCDLFIPDAIQNEIRSVFNNVLNGYNDSKQYENEIITKNKNKLFISWNSTLLHNEKKEVSGIACIGVNITDHRNYELKLTEKNDEIEAQIEEYQQLNEEYLQINEELNQTNSELIIAKDKAEESDKLKTAFLANMSHEIRTPMNGILGFAELLKEPALTGERQLKYISMIEKGGARLLNIINDLINISKIESGQTKILISDCNINEQIEYIYTFFKPEVERGGMQIFFQNGLRAKEAVIKTDREKIIAILTNLVKNAIKYSDSGTIELGYKLKNRYLEFFVKDTGIGIPQDKIEVIFDRFVQADIADKRAYQGAGLGLSITKAYVEMLGGKLWVESEEGKGSTFYFTIPYNIESEKVSDIKNIVFMDEEEKQVAKLKILIAEDDESSALLMTEIVSMYCDDVMHVWNGLEAVEACINHSDIDLILMDIKMPMMDGYEATERIRQFNKSIIIIAQTAYVITGDKEKALAAGCDDYISKPIDKSLMKTLIKKHFNKMENENELRP